MRNKPDNGQKKPTSEITNTHPFETVYDYIVTTADGEFRGSLKAPRSLPASAVTALVMRMVAQAAHLGNLPLDPFNATVTLKKQKRHTTFQ
jgi:hypothetical protein